MKVTMMLCDYAQVADGKLTIVGGGWSVTGPLPAPFALALLFEVPWDRANTRHRFRLDLVDQDGHVVFIPTDEGEEPLAIEGEFEAGRPPGGRFEWRLSVNGESDENWRLPFSTRSEEDLTDTV